MNVEAAAPLGVPATTRPADIDTIQVGSEWISEASGGLNRYYSELLQELPKLGIGVRGLVVGSERVATETGGAVRSFAPLGSSLPTRLTGVRASVRRAFAECPDALFVSHFPLYAAPCLDLQRGRPLVVHFQGPWSAESGIEGDGLLARRAKHWTESRVYKRAARLIVLSRAFARLLEEHYDVPAERIRVIPGAVNTRRFLPTRSRGDARRALGWPTDRPIVLVVRRLVRRMGLENLLAAVRLAKVSVPDVLVMIAGAGPLSDELKQRAQTEGLASNVRFTGFLPEDDLPCAYRAADLSVVPSVALEGFGLIVAESLAAGTPALVTNVGGLPETIEHLSPQCVVHECGVRPLAAMLVDALRGTLPLPPLAECIRHAQAHFDWSVVTGRVRDTYLEAVS